MSDHPRERIRNFCIIAHIDHGKSTLADRLIERTGTLSAREMENQVLDSMDIERERGITIKAQAVRLLHRAKDGQDYVLNLIDTPGHVDFNYEVSRALAACEGALLVVDASQGVEAQTLANVYLALEHDLEIIPVINKIDLPGADPEKVGQEIEDDIGLDSREAILCSAKEGRGVPEILEAIVERIPPPKGDADGPLQALVFDSYFDAYRGVIVFVRVVNGRVKVGDTIRMMATGAQFEVSEVGVLRPKQQPIADLAAGEVGYIGATIRNVQDARVGDTVTHAKRPAAEPLPGYKQAVPMVFCGLYPVATDDYQDLRDALEKVALNDASLLYEPETSVALGFGFRCGFLGLLHMEVVQERLERHYGLDLIATAPSVSYHVRKTDGTAVVVENPIHMPPANHIEAIEEPYVKVTILTPADYVGAVMELAQSRRAVYRTMDYLTSERTQLIYEMPLSEMITDFFDQLKSRTKGYASMDYELCGYRESELVKLDILLAGEPVDALSAIVHRDKAAQVGRQLAEKLRQLIPRQLFEVPIQAAIGAKIVARETVSAKRKDVLAKCYGGDITRKRKLLEKQKEGKKRMKQVGRVEIPQEAFMAVLKIGE
ncbi:MAG: translation elongation factor 4 [Cyanobacteria bacterium REEB65]|nr:translation elongation factor 4 [Cyanobacteria bacterium REEB65]